MGFPFIEKRLFWSPCIRPFLSIPKVSHALLLSDLQCLQFLHSPWKTVRTWSPSRRSVTPSPTLSTIPVASWPKMRGKIGVCPLLLAARPHSRMLLDSLIFLHPVLQFILINLQRTIMELYALHIQTKTDICYSRLWLEFWALGVAEVTSKDFFLLYTIFKCHIFFLVFWLRCTCSGQCRLQGLLLFFSYSKSVETMGSHRSLLPCHFDSQ